MHVFPSNPQKYKVEILKSCMYLESISTCIQNQHVDRNKIQYIKMKYSIIAFHQSVTYSDFFGQTGTYVQTTKAPPCLAPSRKIFKISASRCSKNVPPVCLFLDFFVKHFPDYLSFHCETVFHG